MSPPAPELDTKAAATAFREEGNALYKSGKVAQGNMFTPIQMNIYRRIIFIACRKYQEAVKLTPDDSLPSRNLSAAYYELGKYK